MTKKVVSLTYKKLQLSENKIKKKGYDQANHKVKVKNLNK